MVFTIPPSVKVIGVKLPNGNTIPIRTIDGLSELKQELYELLEFPSKDNTSTVIDAEFNKILQCREENNLLACHANQLRMDYLVQNLKSVKNANPIAFKSICKDLKNVRNDHSFYGHRFEAYFASFLSVQNLSYEKSERPDFSSIRNLPIFVECGSLRSGGAKVGLNEYSKKLVDRIAEKESQPYAIPNCALILDLTNLIFNLTEDESQGIWDQLCKVAAENSDNEKFGATYLYFQAYSQKENNIRYSFDRTLSPNITKDLQQFLDEYLPCPGATISGPAIPKEG